MEKNEEFKIVYVTTDSLDNAKHIARIVVTEKLAACCTIIQSVISIFSWQNSLQERMEYILMLKTAANKLTAIESRVSELHPDEVPEIIAVNISDMSPQYKNWMNQVLNEN